MTTGVTDREAALPYGGEYENGRIPQCCPERFLIPNQAGALAPPYPMK